MKIAIINVTGSEGSTGKIATKLANHYIKAGHSCRVYHGRGTKLNDDIHKKYGNRMDTIIHYLQQRITDKEGYYSTLNTLLLLRDMKAFAPDHLVFLNLHGHYLNIPLFMNSVAKSRATFSYFMCDEFPFTARCTYAGECGGFRDQCRNCPQNYKNLEKQYQDKKEYYQTIADRTVFSSVGYIVDRARQSSLLKDKDTAIINTGIDTDYYHPVETKAYREKLKIPGDKVILIDVAPYSNTRKGIRYFIDAARLLETEDRFVFINVGYDGKDIELPKNFIPIPYVSNQDELRTLYALADAYICTSTEDALPNACVEAMSCGTPIIAFNVSGMPYIAKAPVLTLAKGISADALACVIRTIKAKDPDTERVCRAYAEDNYAFTGFADKLLQTGNQRKEP